MTKKLFSCLFLAISLMLSLLPMSVKASGGTRISTVVPYRYTITLDIDGSGSVEYEEVSYKDGETIQVTEGTDMTLKLLADSKYKLKSVSFNGKNITKQVSDNKITIENVQQDGTLVVTYVKSSSILIPKTGDYSNILFWSILTGGSLVIFGGIALKKSKHS